MQSRMVQWAGLPWRSGNQGSGFYFFTDHSGSPGEKCELCSHVGNHAQEPPGRREVEGGRRRRETESSHKPSAPNQNAQDVTSRPKDHFLFFQGLRCKGSFTYAGTCVTKKAFFSTVTMEAGSHCPSCWIRGWRIVLMPAEEQELSLGTRAKLWVSCQKRRSPRPPHSSPLALITLSSWLSMHAVITRRAGKMPSAENACTEVTVG